MLICPIKYARVPFLTNLIFLKPYFPIILQETVFTSYHAQRIVKLNTMLNHGFISCPMMLCIPPQSFSDLPLNPRNLIKTSVVQICHPYRISSPLLDNDRPVKQNHLRNEGTLISIHFSTQRRGLLYNIFIPPTQNKESLVYIIFLRAT